MVFNFINRVINIFLDTLNKKGGISMVRGTNKRIIEINDTQNPYFERAVLYLKDNQADSCKKTLESQAQHFLGSIRAPLLHRARPAFLCSHSRLWLGLSLLLSAAAGGTLTFLLLH